MKRLAQLSLVIAIAMMLSSCTVIAPSIEKMLTPTAEKVFGPAVLSSGPQGHPSETPEAAYPPPEAAPSPSLSMAHEQLDALGTALVQAGILDILAQDGPYTILAPSDEAMAALDHAAMEILLHDQSQLDAFLRAHVVYGILTLEELAKIDTVETLSGTTLPVSVTEEGLAIGDARILEGDFYVPNAIVHTIDHVLYAIPQTPDLASLTKQEPNLSSWASLLEELGLDQWLSTVGPFTLLAPTDQALARFEAENPDILQNPDRLAAIVQYHIIPEAVELSEGMLPRSFETWLGPVVTFAPEGNQYTVNGAKVVLANISALNGVIHLIDTVLIPPETAAATSDIVAWIQVNPELEAIAELLHNTTIPEELASLDSFTLFLPSNTAFAALSTETIASLTSDPEFLSNVLRYHIVPATLLSTDLASITQTLTLAGIPVTIQSEPLAINGARVITPDIRMGHGVIHIIDSVLLPAEASLTSQVAEGAATPAPEAPTPTASPEPTPQPTITEPALAQQIRLTTAIKAIVASGLLSELEQTGPVTVFAPIDRAFDRLSAAELEAWLADPAAMAELLRHHIVAGTLTSQDLVPGTLQTLAGTELEVAIDPTTGQLTVGGAPILWVNMRLGDTVLHIVDGLFLPEEGITPAPPTPTPPIPAETPSQGALAQILRQEPRAETMRALFDLTNLFDRLPQETPLTLLVPTEEAFQAIPQGLLQSLLKRDVLEEVLLQHVISGTVALEELETGVLTPLAGDDLPVSKEAGEWRIGQATIIESLSFEHGRIYLVDRLLIPSSLPLDVMGRLYVTPTLSEWLRLLEKAHLEDLLEQYEGITILAPTDTALAELTEAERAAITADEDALARWVGRHIIPRRMTAAQLAQRRTVETLFGEKIPIRSRRGKLFIDGALVLERDIAATNGLIHTVDTAVLP